MPPEDEEEKENGDGAFWQMAGPAATTALQEGERSRSKSLLKKIYMELYNGRKYTFIVLSSDVNILSFFDCAYACIGVTRYPKSKNSEHVLRLFFKRAEMK